jgi:hypothetical protein
VKYLRGPELIFGLIFIAIVLHLSWLVSIVIFYSVSVVPNPVSRADSLTIAIQS